MTKYNSKEYTITIKVNSDLYWEEIKDILEEEVKEILESSGIEVKSTYVIS